MKKNLICLALICTAPLLSACEPEMPMHRHPGVLTSSQLNINANSVLPTTHVENMQFAASSTEIPAESLRNLYEFREVGVDSVYIYGPENDALADERRLKLVRTMRAAGVPSTRISVLESDLLAADEYRVEVGYASMIPPNCPNWSGSATENYHNLPHSNLGCAIVTSYGHQIMYPRDILVGRGEVRPDSQRAAKAVEDWRKGAATPVSSGDEGGGDGGDEGDSEGN